MTYSTVLFDLDGTLLNTLYDLRASMNRALAAFGFPPRTMEEVRSFVGNGMKDYTARAVPPGTDEDTKAAVLSAFKKDYAEHCADDTVPYDGILPMLEALKANGIKTAIVSNKGDFAVKLLAKHYFNDLVDAALGETATIPKKPAPDMVRAALSELNASIEHALYVGDSDVDFDTAMNAGLDVALVDWGFRDRSLLSARLASLPDSRKGTIVSTVDDLLSVIL